MRKWFEFIIFVFTIYCIVFTLSVTIVNLGYGAEIIDYYPTENGDSTYVMYSTYPAFGQSFNVSNGGTLDSAEFYIKKLNNPTGYVYAEIYEHTGTYGTTSKPTGSALAISDGLDVSTLSGISFEIKTFTFSGANRITLSGGDTKYVSVITYSGGDASNAVSMRYDNTSPTHGGNLSYKTGGTWYILSTADIIFYVYKASVSNINTRDKRASAINIPFSYMRPFPTPGQ